MKKSCNTPFGSKHPTPERRSILFHSLADLTVKDDNKIMTKKPAVQQEVSCFVLPVFLYNYALFTLSENYPRSHTP